MSLTNILEIELFNVWSIDFMRPFPQSFINFYIIIVVDYLSKGIDTITTPNNDVKVVTKLLIKNSFSRHGAPITIISDEGTHICNKPFENLMSKY